MRLLVIDTNVALDLLVFRDPSTASLDDALAQGTCRWIATAGMREELARVLGYPQIAARLCTAGVSEQEVLDQFDGRVHLVEPAEAAAVTCSDPDDQQFVDLAVQHRATLLSKDAAVLCLRQRLVAAQVAVAAVLPLSSYSLSES
jgi:putative PIN family toxin of toxin-antitoxin system